MSCPSFIEYIYGNVVTENDRRDGQETGLTTKLLVTIIRLELEAVAPTKPWPRPISH